MSAIASRGVPPRVVTYEANPLTGVIEITAGGEAIDIGSGGGGGSTVSTLTVSRNLAVGDNGRTLVYSGASDIVLTVTSALPEGFACTVVQQGGGLVSFVQGADVGFDNIGSTRGSGTFTTMVQVAFNQYGFQNPTPTGPVTLLKAAIPFILISAWTFGANGALTSGATLNRAYVDAYLYFPADAIGAGVPAGWYYTKFTTTTVGTAYNTRYLGGKPTIPETLTAFATSAGSVVAQDTSVINGPEVTLPGGAMGPSGIVRSEIVSAGSSSSANKAIAIKLGASDISAITMNASITSAERFNAAQNMASESLQLTRAGALDSGTSALQFRTINTAIDQTVAFTMRLQTAAAGDYLCLQRYMASYEYGG